MRIKCACCSNSLIVDGDDSIHGGRQSIATLISERERDQMAIGIRLTRQEVEELVAELQSVLAE